MTQFWEQFCRALANIDDTNKQQVATLFFKDLLIELAKLCSNRSIMSDTHLLFLNDHLDNEDEKIEEFESKNK